MYMTIIFKQSTNVNKNKQKLHYYKLFFSLFFPFPTGGMMGSRPIGSTSAISSKPSPGQTTQAYMQGQPAQQPYGPGGPRFNPLMHHDMQGSPTNPYGMPPHPMSPTGAAAGMHRQRPPHFGMGGDMSRMPRPPRGMPMRPMPPHDMMGSPDQGMRPRMPPHQFMSPSHPGMGEMPPTSHGGIPMSSHGMPPSPHAMQTSPLGGMQQSSPHGIPTSPHGIPTSPHGVPTSPHTMQRPPMMSSHHPMMQGGTPTSVGMGASVVGGAGVPAGGGPLASLANFHPPGHQGINTSMASPIANMGGPHIQRPPMFPQMMGEQRMANRLRMMASGDGSGIPPMSHQQYRHMMMMRGVASQQGPPPLPPQHMHAGQMSSPQMSPHHMSPQMSPGAIQGTQPLRHMDLDDKSLINMQAGGLGLGGMGDDAMPHGGMMPGSMGGQPRAAR